MSLLFSLIFIALIEVSHLNGESIGDVSAMNRRHGRLESQNLFPQGVSRQMSVVPEYDFQFSIPQGAVVAGLSLVWLKEISAAFGTWYLIPILLTPIILLGVTVAVLPTNLWTEIIPSIIG